MRSPGWCSGPSYDPVTVVTRVQIPLRALRFPSAPTRGAAGLPSAATGPETVLLLNSLSNEFPPSPRSCLPSGLFERPDIELVRVEQFREASDPSDPLRSFSAGVAPVPASLAGRDSPHRICQGDSFGRRGSYRPPVVGPYTHHSTPSARIPDNRSPLPLVFGCSDDRHRTPPQDPIRSPSDRAVSRPPVPVSVGRLRADGAVL